MRGKEIKVIFCGEREREKKKVGIKTNDRSKLTEHLGFFFFLFLTN